MSTEFFGKMRATCQWRRDKPLVIKALCQSESLGGHEAEIVEGVHLEREQCVKTDIEAVGLVNRQRGRYRLTDRDFFGDCEGVFLGLPYGFGFKSLSSVDIDTD